MKKFKRLMFLMMSLILIMYSAIRIFLWINDNNKNKLLNNKLKNLSLVDNVNIEYTNDLLINPPEEENDSYWNYVDLDFLKIDFTDLSKINPDTVGWIQVGGTNVDYPIVQGTDNEYYLEHSFDNSLNSAGWIFLDFRNDLENLKKNNIIYGHSRVDDTMFGSLRYVLEDQWFQNSENHIIKLSTLESDMIWQIFSVYSIPDESYYIRTNFFNDDSFQNFLDTIVNRSKFSFPTNININDKILTLSTCRDNYGNKLVIHARLIKKGTRL